MRFALAALSLAVLAAPAFAQDGPIMLSPEQLGQVFCLSRLGNDMAPVVGLLTPGLAAAIAEAEARDAAWAAANRGDKPPLGDGIPWQAAPDYAAVCAAGPVIEDNGAAEVEVFYGFPDYPDANFTDRLMLQPVEDPLIGTARWRLDDIAYATGGTLRETLTAVFAE